MAKVILVTLAMMFVGSIAVSAAKAPLTLEQAKYSAAAALASCYDIREGTPIGHVDRVWHEVAAGLLIESLTTAEDVSK